MSYSRWTTSRWYTLYVANESFERDKQYFDVCMVRCFSFKELVEDLDKCLNEAVEKENRDSRFPVTEKEKLELRSYMLEFIQDVRNDRTINDYMKVKEAPDENLALFVDLDGPAAKLLETRIKNLTGGLC